MCNSNKTRFNPPAAAAAFLVLFLLQLLLPDSHGDAVKTGAKLELLPNSRPLLDANSPAGSSDLEQLIEAKLNETARQTTNSQELLSRKRRYLLFPEGSSFQMVFDEIICVVDYTNYLVLGITVALAWELPSKPPSEALEDLLTKLDDGTIDISRNDTVSNITYVEDAKTPAPVTQNPKPNYINLSNGGAGSNGYNSYYSNSPVFRTPMHPTHQYVNSYYRGGPYTSAPARRKDNYYYSSMRDPFQKWSQSYSPVQNTRYPYWALASHLKNTLSQRNKYYNREKSPIQRKVSIQGTHQKEQARRHHKIYPVFGKRSIPDAANPHHRQRRSGISSPHDDKLTRMEGIQIKYHRNSRQTLYERIEKYLDKRGQNGHQCVLRTLCETGQKSHEKEPGSFVGELLRAVFTLPEALEHEPVAYKDTRYDRAHAHDGDCAALYPECKQSIWDAPFIQ